MRIIDPGTQPLSNAEVLAHLTSQPTTIPNYPGIHELPEELKKITRETITYLSRPTQPASRSRAPAALNPDAIHNLTTTLKNKPWRLLQSEILQILNHVPREITELGMVVEELDQRFEPEQQELLLKVIQDECAKWR
ncbi:hypothetical protein BT63DRAFT_430655 [Microthyrium microscopicum]|uniref:DNA-directed RNA polymerase III subunit RPC9 n=1 Tax=Microthyrium microscopicum TaxID=703497 RepID=A0A6A6TWS4_9PEZI|nr:hypothetical protein BT63DRAFT_430655 [Microthyrium microscopicum]